MQRDQHFCQSIQSLTLFSSLSSEHIDTMLKQGKITYKDYSIGEIVHLEDDPCSSIEVVLTGQLSVERLGEEGEVFTIATFTRDALIGGNIVFSTFPHYPHTIFSVEKSKLIRVEKEVLYQLLLEYSGILKNFLQIISDNTVMVNDRLSNMVHHTLRQRIVLYIRAEMVRQNTKNIVLSITKTHLAKILGVSRTSLSRELAKMRDEGLLKFHKKNMMLLPE